VATNVEVELGKGPKDERETGAGEHENGQGGEEGEDGEDSGSSRTGSGSAHRNERGASLLDELAAELEAEEVCGRVGVCMCAFIFIHYSCLRGHQWCSAPKSPVCANEKPNRVNDLHVSATRCLSITLMHTGVC
jgi:hypothetical protein